MRITTSTEDAKNAAMPVVKHTTNLGLLNMLTVLFVGLKLTGNITWSWWWVTAPAWIPLAIILSLALIWFLVYMVVRILD